MSSEPTTTEKTDTASSETGFRSALAERTAALRLQSDSKGTICEVTDVRYAINNSVGMIDENYWFEIPVCVLEVDLPGGTKHITIDLRDDWLETGIMQVLHSADAVDDDGHVHAEALTGHRLELEPEGDDKHRVFISPPNVERAATDTVVLDDRPLVPDADMSPDDGLNDALTQLYHQYREGETNWWRTQITNADPIDETTLEVACETITGQEITWEYELPDYQWEEDSAYTRLVEEIGQGDYEGLEDEYVHIRQWQHVHPPDIDCLNRSVDGSWVMALPEDVKRSAAPSGVRERTAAVIGNVRDRIKQTLDTSTPTATLN